MVSNIHRDSIVPQLEWEDFENAMSSVCPSVLQKCLDTQIPRVHVAAFHVWDDQIELLKASVLLLLDAFERFGAMGVSLPRGVLLCGPPGSKETYIGSIYCDRATRKNYVLAY
jgi:ATP-dependent 26S proteasome regulatory subunit